MRSLTIASFLSFGAGSLAFLIPPGMNEKIDTASLESASIIPQIATVKAKMVEVKCPSCPYFEGFAEDGTPIYSRKENSLVLSFDVGTDFISLNGHPFFPGIYGAMTPAPFFAEQKPTEKTSAKPSQDPKQVDIAFDMFVETDKDNISRVRVHVTSVGGMTTDPRMDIVEFPVYQDEQDHIIMGEAVVRKPTSKEVSSAICNDAILCKWLAYFDDKLSSLKDKYNSAVKGKKKGGCHGRKKGGTKGDHASNAKSGKVHHGHHGHHGHKEEHEHEDKHRHDEEQKEQVHDTFKGYFDPTDEPQYGVLMSILLFAVVPVIVGSITGMLVCLIGVFVGHCVVIGWRKITGKSDETLSSENIDEEKEGLLKDDEEYGGHHTIPEYADGLPVYTETEEI